MNPGDLTTLANVKAWLGVQGTATDVMLEGLITAASTSVLNHLGRAPLAVTSYTEIYDVTPARILLLRQWPVLSVASISLDDGTTITNDASQSWPMSSGYLLEPFLGEKPQRLELIGYFLRPGRAAAKVTYTAGYQVTGEAQTVPAAAPYTVTSNQTWIADGGVTYANGTALTAVTGTPAPGQYSVSAGVYTFSAADEGAAVKLTYSNAPAPVAQAVLEIVGEAFRRKDHIGQSSKSQQGQGVIAYSQLPLNKAACEYLEPYVRKIVTS